MHFVYIKVPLRDMDRPALDALHQALEEALAAAGAGALIGWGTSVPTPTSRLNDPMAFHRVDLDLADLEGALALVRDTLTQRALPSGTELHYTAQGAELQMAWTQDGWSMPAPRSMPGGQGIRRSRA